MSDRWREFDLLIRELGVVRLFTDEAERLSLKKDPDIEAVEKALRAASGMIARLTREDSDELVLQAWQAIASAREAMRHARDVVARARAARAASAEVRRRAQEQQDRIRRRSEARDPAAARLHERLAKGRESGETDREPDADE